MKTTRSELDFAKNEPVGSILHNLSDDYETLQTSHKKLLDALKTLLKNPNLYPCEHNSTHRGGVIWSICDDCGESFADDRGGVPKPTIHSSITKAETALSNADKLIR